MEPNSMLFLVFQRYHLRSTSGSFVVQDHLPSNLGIISGLRINCGQGSFAVLYRTPQRTIVKLPGNECAMSIFTVYLYILHWK